MTARLRAFARGTGSATLIAYALAFAALMVAFGFRNGFLIGILAGGFATMRVELNKLRARIQTLEHGTDRDSP